MIETQPSHSQPRLLTALPVYNEAAHLSGVLDQVARHADDILVVDDGSSDDTPRLLANRNDVQVLTHPENRGYGAALRTAFCYARRNRYDLLVTIDCDGQHEPQRIRELAAHCAPGIDIVSGSRYLAPHDESLGAENQGVAPADRKVINQTITDELNQRLGLGLTDAFCGFKAYRVASLSRLRLTEDGYAMPLELWVQAAQLGLTVQEVSVPLIYLDEKRSFGGELDDAARRLKHYREVINRAMDASEGRGLASSPDPCDGLLRALPSQPEVAV